MYKHDPSNPNKRLAVIRKTDSVQVGTMPYAVGMVLANGATVVRFTKIGTPVVTGLYGATYEEPFRGLASVELPEAYKHGYPHKVPSETGTP